jgi:hypothetical protein
MPAVMPPAIAGSDRHIYDWRRRTPGIIIAVLRAFQARRFARRSSHDLRSGIHDPLVPFAGSERHDLAEANVTDRLPGMPAEPTPPQTSAPPPSRMSTVPVLKPLRIR